MSLLDKSAAREPATRCQRLALLVFVVGLAPGFAGAPLAHAQEVLPSPYDEGDGKERGPVAEPASEEEELSVRGAAPDEEGDEEESFLAAVRAGALVGMNFSSYLGSDVANAPTRTHSFKPAPAIGGFVRAPLSDVFSLRAEILLSQKGARFSAGDVGGSDNFRYLSFPLLGVIDLAFEGPLSPYLYGGPVLSYLLTAGHQQAGEEPVDLKDVTRSADFGVAIGAGFAFPAGGSSLAVEVRYELGLVNFDREPTPSGLDRQAQHSVVTLLAGYEF